MSDGCVAQERRSEVEGGETVEVGGFWEKLVVVVEVAGGLLPFMVGARGVAAVVVKVREEVRPIFGEGLGRLGGLTVEKSAMA